MKINLFSVKLFYGLFYDRIMVEFVFFYCDCKTYWNECNDGKKMCEKKSSTKISLVIINPNQGTQSVKMVPVVDNLRLRSHAKPSHIYQRKSKQNQVMPSQNKMFQTRKKKS